MAKPAFLEHFVFGLSADGPQVEEARWLYDAGDNVLGRSGRDIPSSRRIA
jgi:hypothetical protein